MHLKPNTNRREFLASALAATGSAVAIGLCSSDSKAEVLVKSDNGGKPVLSPASLYDTSTRATAMTGEAADRLAIRKLVDAWAHCADRRLAKEQSELFVPDGTVIVYDGDPATHEPKASLKGRAEILKALAVLNTFTATTHFNGQSDVVISGDHAVGETYCLAHQLFPKMASESYKFSQSGIKTNLSGKNIAGILSRES
jgi:hypothetical protein